MFGSTHREPKQHEPDEALVREVGVQLRQARIARGEELEQVAENLRIRPAYLRGLEQGDLSVMPGRTYALGFLRSYAQYLGFDGDDLIAQIRSSVAGLTGGAHLHGRMPLAESRLPKLPILVISLAALAGIYAGWAYVDDRSRPEVELVAEVPDDLRQQSAGPDVTPAIAPAPEVVQVAPPPQPFVVPEAGGRERFAAQEAGPSTEEAAPAPQIERSPAQGQTASDVSAPEPGETGQGGAGTSGAAPGPTADADRAALAALQPPATGQSTPGLAPDPAAPSAAEVLATLEPLADGDAPTTYRSDDAAARVILRARTSAWVHVSSTNNDYLWVRTLQPGDAFVVPDRPDLVLWTGNAGGIEVIVDGAPLPPLGPEARVVRDVSLQPEDLLRRLQPAAGQ